MSDHRKEVWKWKHWEDKASPFDECCIWREGDKEPITHALGRHNARRIVACINACAGIPTEWLENEPLGGLKDRVERELGLKGFFK